MRKHEKNIGKKVYFCCKFDYKDKIYEGLLVNIDYECNRARIYCGETNKVELFYLKDFNNNKSSWWNDKSWGYTDKNVKKFYVSIHCKVTKPQIKKHYIKFTASGVTQYSYSKFLEFLKIDLEGNKHRNRYEKELGKFFEYFSKKRQFEILKIEDGRWDYRNDLRFVITKQFYENERQPVGVQIEFYYNPFGITGSTIRINKFDKFVKTYEIIEGKGYNAD